MKIDRRGFLGSIGACALASGCRSLDMLGGPDLRFGVVSDIHVTTPESCAMFERALRIFKARGVDAVMVPGDLTDWGLKASLMYVKETWDRVFAGTGVVPLFCTGNHDYDGWAYGDMTMEMHANGYDEHDRLYRRKDESSMAAAWKEVFGEDFAGVRLWTVKGYDFIAGEYHGADGLSAFMKRHGDRFRGGRPFFYFQHLPIRGTTHDSFGWADGGRVGPVLNDHPNCIAFTGHTHVPFNDERSIWQGAYTIVNVPSLSYSCTPGGCENGECNRAEGAPPVMEKMPYRRELRGGQGFVVSVWGDRVVIERRDLEEDACDLPDWVVPLSAARPYTYAARADKEPVPAFPAGATVALGTSNAENRLGDWAIVLDCRFPSAVVPAGHRVRDYEIQAVPCGGGLPVVRRFAATSYARLAKYEPARQRFWFDARDLPQDEDYVVAVRARNCFGRASAPIYSRVMRGKPGLDKVDESVW